MRKLSSRGASDQQCVVAENKNWVRLASGLINFNWVWQAGRDDSAIELCVETLSPISVDTAGEMCNLIYFIQKRLIHLFSSYEKSCSSSSSSNIKGWKLHNFKSHSLKYVCTRIHFYFLTNKIADVDKSDLTVFPQKMSFSLKQSLSRLPGTHVM